LFVSTERTQDWDTDILSVGWVAVASRKIVGKSAISISSARLGWGGRGSSTYSIYAGKRCLAEIVARLAASSSIEGEPGGADSSYARRSKSASISLFV